MKRKVRLSGFPDVGFTAKVSTGRNEHMFVKLGTGELGSEDFVIEFDLDASVQEGSAEEIVAALDAWTEMVCDVQLKRLHELTQRAEREFAPPAL